MGLYFGFFTWLTQIFIKISDAYALTVSVELIKIGHKVVSLLLLVYFIYLTSFDLDGYFNFHYISLGSFLFILSWLFIKKQIFSKNLFNLKNLSIRNLSKEFIGYSHPLLITSIIGLISGIFDIWLLQKYAGSIQTGFYGLAYSLAAMCFVFTSAMTPIITREFSKSYEQKNIKEMKRLYYRYVPMLYSLAAYFSIFISMQSETVIEIFTDAKFRDAGLVLMVMAFYPIHQTYGQLSGSIFYATGQTRLIRNISFVIQPVGMILSFSFIYILDFAAVGLAMKMIIGQIIGTNIQLYLNSKYLGFNMKYFILHQVYAVLLFVLIAYISSYIVNFTSEITSFLISGGIYTVLVIIFSYIFPQIFATSRVEINSLVVKIIKR